MQCPPYAGVVRALGAEVAELPALAVRPELQGNALGRLLLSVLEAVLREAGVKLVAMPALVPFPTSSPKQDTASDGQTSAPSTSQQVSSYHTTCLTCLVCSTASCLIQQALGSAASELQLLPRPSSIVGSGVRQQELVRHHIDVPCATWVITCMMPGNRRCRSQTGRRLWGTGRPHAASWRACQRCQSCTSPARSLL